MQLLTIAHTSPQKQTRCRGLTYLAREQQCWPRRVHQAEHANPALPITSHAALTFNRAEPGKPTTSTTHPPTSLPPSFWYTPHAPSTFTFLPATTPGYSSGGLHTNRNSFRVLTPVGFALAKRSLQAYCGVSPDSLPSNAALHALFTAASAFGDEAFYTVALPLSAWVLDLQLSRRLAFFWASTYYVGQSTKVCACLDYTCCRCWRVLYRRPCVGSLRQTRCPLGGKL